MFVYRVIKTSSLLFRQENILSVNSSDQVYTTKISGGGREIPYVLGDKIIDVSCVILVFVK